MTVAHTCYTTLPLVLLLLLLFFFFDLSLFSIQVYIAYLYYPVYVCNEVAAMAGVVLDCNLPSSERDVHRCCRY